MMFELQLQTISSALDFVKAQRVTIVDASNTARLASYMVQNRQKISRPFRGLWRSMAEFMTVEEAKRAIRVGAVPIEWEHEFGRAVREFVQDDLKRIELMVFSEVGEDIARRVNALPRKEFAFNVTRDRVRQKVEEHGAELITRVTEAQILATKAALLEYIIAEAMTPYELAKRLRHFIGLTEKYANAVLRLERDLVAQGLGRDVVAKQVERYAEFLHKVRAENIARTELSFSYNAGQLEAIRQAREDGYLIGDVFKKWNTTGQTGRVCDECEALDGEEVRENETFSAGVEAPPLHPQCLLGNTPVLIPDPKKAFVVSYEGPLIRIMFVGGNITVTPNHLFLTSQGFASASRLRKGDKILYYTPFKRIAFRDPNNNGQPPTIKQIIAALSKTCRMTTGTVPVSSENFHGDGTFMNGDIDIIWPDGFKQSDGEAVSIKRNGQTSFEEADTPLISFPGSRDLKAMLFRLRDATDGGVGSRSDSPPFFDREPLHYEFGAFGKSPLFDAAPSQPSGDRIAVNLKHFSDRRFGKSGEIELRDVLGIEINSSHGLIPVYDIETTSTLYISNGLMSSNCGCGLSYETRR